MDDRARWARFQGAGLEAVGSAPQPASAAELRALCADSLDLAHDPAKGGKPDDKSIEEAAVAVLGERLGALRGLSRESTGYSEFVDADGVKWDVKSPFSPPADKPGWLFDANHQRDVLHDDLSNGEGILLDMTRVNRRDAGSLLEVLQTGLTQDERGHVLLLLDEGLL